MNIAILLAGGVGKRLGAEKPKQFVELCGIPVLMRTMVRFEQSGVCDCIIVVLPADQIGQWKELCCKHGFDIPHQVVAGGDTRFQSVKNGLAAMTIEPPEEIVASTTEPPLTLMMPPRLT